MSVVVAIKDGDRVWMACDSQTTMGWAKETRKTPNNYKIFKQQNDVIIGVVGRAKLNNILRVEDNLIDELEHLKENVDFKYIVKTLVPKIYKICEKYSLLRKEKDDDEKYIDGAITLAYKNNIYAISSDGCVAEVVDYCADGSGCDLAMGYLNQNQDDDKKEAVIKAVKSACVNDLHVSYPIIVMNTKDDEVIIIEK